MTPACRAAYDSIMRLLDSTAFTDQDLADVAAEVRSRMKSKSKDDSGARTVAFNWLTIAETRVRQQERPRVRLPTDVHVNERQAATSVYTRRVHLRRHDQRGRCNSVV